MSERQFPKNGFEFARYEAEGKGTITVNRSDVQYTDDDTGVRKVIRCASNKDARFQADFYRRSYQVSRKIAS